MMRLSPKIIVDRNILTASAGIYSVQCIGLEPEGRQCGIQEFPMDIGKERIESIRWSHQGAGKRRKQYRETNAQDTGSDSHDNRVSKLLPKLRVSDYLFQGIEYGITFTSCRWLAFA